MNISKALEWLDNNGLYVNFYDGIVEPGYEDKPTFLANWNENKLSKFAKAVEHGSDVELEWDDEWSSCTECHKGFRISGNRYGWVKYAHLFTDECEEVCGDCIKKDPDEYLEDLVNNPNKAEVFDLGLDTLGYSKVNGTFESGWHPGQDDQPEEILKKIERIDPDCSVIFKVASVGQFDVTFEAWYNGNYTPEHVTKRLYGRED